MTTEGPRPAIAPPAVEIRADGPADLAASMPRWGAFEARRGAAPLSMHPGWLEVLRDGLGHEPRCLEVVEGGETRGLLPLAFVRGPLFGRFLVGLPYLNYGGVMADDEATARLLVGRAIELADRLGVRYLELRHERAVDDPRLATRSGRKVLMRRPLPASADELWGRLKSSVRNQVRKARGAGVAVAWGGEELLPAFHDVFSRNMRDLGTPSYGRSLFRAILRRFPDRAEFCVASLGGRPVAAALLLHGRGVTEVPSASSLRRYNPTCANMLMYWHLLERAVGRGQGTFDFGRSTPGGPVHRFKAQWGAAPAPAEWQYAVREGDGSEARPDNPAYRRLVAAWRRMPVGLTRRLGPAIVRGIP